MKEINNQKEVIPFKTMKYSKKNDKLINKDYTKKAMNNELYKYLISIILSVICVILIQGCNSPKISDYVNKNNSPVATRKPESTLNTDYIKDKNQRGNSTGNIVNHGIATIQGNCIYYWQGGYDSGIYKENCETSQNIKILELKDYNFGEYINIIGEYIYYVDVSRANIYRVKIDGSDNIIIDENAAQNLNVVGDWIYYSSFYYEGGIYKINTEGKYKSKLADEYAPELSVSGDWIYYPNFSDEQKLYKISIDGSNKTKLNDEESSYINVCGEWIYYINESDEKSIYRMNIDGKEKTKILEGPVSTINVTNDWIFYCETVPTPNYSTNEGDFTYSGRIHRMKKDGSSNAELDDGISYGINVVGDWIYFKQKEGYNVYILYKMKIDGTDKSKLEE